MATREPSRFTFEVDPLAEDTFEVLSFTGEEAISQPFSFVVELRSLLPAIDVVRILGRRATLSLTHRGETRVVQGMVGRFEAVAQLSDELFQYRAVLVPRLRLLGAGRASRLHGADRAVTVIDIVTEVLSRTESTPGSPPLVDTVEFRLSREHHERRNLLQHEESDLAFLSRLLERSGVFYFFEPGDDGEHVVIADANHAFHWLDEPRDRVYAPGATPVPGMVPIKAFKAVAKPLPRRLVLSDYNYELPHLSLRAEIEIDPRGAGEIMVTDETFATPDEGHHLATLRAEGLLCRQITYRGKGASVSFAAGRRFELDEHFRGALNRSYVIERVSHAGWQTLPDEPEALREETEIIEAGYRNRFVVLEDDRPYRPEIVTPRPVFHGIMTAHVSGEGDGRRAELDEHGRYTLVMHHLHADDPESRRSPPVRMAQPHVGVRSGVHFPLLKGTEVVVAAVGGNPERPIILGAVPNPMQTSIVTRDTQTRNRIQTPTGILLELSDGTPRASADAATAEAEGEAAETRSEATDVESDAAAEAVVNAAPPGAAPRRAGGRERLETWVRLKVPDYGGAATGQASYLRLGRPGAADEPADAGAIDGWVDYTRGDRLSVTEGDAAMAVRGRLTERVAGDRADHVAGASSFVFGGDRSELSVSVDHRVSLGFATRIAARDTLAVTLGTAVDHARSRVDVSGTRIDAARLRVESATVSVSRQEAAEVRHHGASVEYGRYKIFL